MKPQILISGYASLDRIIRIKTPVRAGYTSIVENVDNAKIYYGGCPVNIACALAKLGFTAAPVIRVGNDYRKTGFKAFLENAGVCLGAVREVEGDTTGNCYLLLDKDKNHVTVFYPGAMDEKYFSPLPDDLFAGARLGVVTVGGYKDNRHFYEKCREHSIPIVLGMKCDGEAFPTDFLWELLKNSEILFMNAAERRHIEKKFGLRGISDFFDGGRAKIIVTTFGKKGSGYMEKTDGGIASGDICIARGASAVDTTGSGDAYIGGFLYGYLQGKSVAQCCGYGSTLASFAVETMGALTNIPDSGRLEERFKKCF
jgi:adenosine kinase